MADHLKSRIAPSGDLDIYEAATFRDTLLDAFQQSDEVVVDLAAVESVDTAAVQVLLAARRSAGEQSIHFCWENATPEVTNTLALMGARG